MAVSYLKDGKPLPYPVTITTAPAPAKPIDQMTAAELKAEYQRRCPGCGPKPPAAQGG